MMKLDIRVIDPISAVLAYKVASTAIQVAEAFRDGAEELENYARQNAPWEDQTGNARALLNATAGVDMGYVTLTLAHGVDYGIWLETIQDGTYAIIMPTIEAVGPRILKDAGAAVMSF